jgi:peroxiredoxin
MPRLLLALLSYIFLTSGAYAEVPPPDSLRAPAFRVQTVRGDTLHLRELRGSVVVLNFWHIGCDSCVSEISGLNQLALDFKDRDVVFIAFARNAQKPLAQFLRQRPFYYRQVAHAVPVSDAYKIPVDQCPTHIVIGKDGVIRHRQKGGSLTTAQTLRPIIEDVLKASAPAAGP